MGWGGEFIPIIQKLHIKIIQWEQHEQIMHFHIRRVLKLIGIELRKGNNSLLKRKKCADDGNKDKENDELILISKEYKRWLKNYQPSFEF